MSAVLSLDLHLLWGQMWNVTVGSPVVMEEALQRVSTPILSLSFFFSLGPHLQHMEVP